MTEDPDYSEASDTALKRDRHTCQLCGTVGYPKTERGLAAVPVKQDDHRVENLVTVCHECLKKDDEQLREETSTAKARRQRRTGSQDITHTSNTDSDRTVSSSVRTRLQAAIRTAGNGLRSLLPERQPDDVETSDQLIHRVARRDNYNCQVCGSVVIPRGRVGYVMGSAQPEGEVDGPIDENITICWDCVEWEDNDVADQKTRQAIELKTASKEPSLKYTKACLRELAEKLRVFAHTGQAVVLRRALVATIGLALLLVMGVAATGAIGALFVSPETGLQWAESTLAQYQAIGLVLFDRSWLAFVGIAVGYVVHVYEQERAYERELFRDERRRGETPSIGHGRPRWQFVAGLAAVGLFGAVDWILVRHGIFPDGMLFGALVFWGVGSAGVAFYLRKALREDRDIHGQPVNPAPWVFASRYALFVALASAVASYLPTNSLLPSIALELALIAAPLAGALYVGRRLAEQRTVWGARTMYSIRSVIDRVWSLDDDWPPTEQNQNSTNTSNTEPHNG